MIDIPRPLLVLDLPRPLRALHQIEITSHCNLRCVYCTSPTLGRPKLHMSRSTFERALKWVVHYVKHHDQWELNLAGIGESTLHPDFVEYVRLAREAVGPSVDLVFATNGLLMTEKLADALKPYRPKVGVSLHRPEKAGPAIEILRERGMLLGAAADAATAAIDWAGQVDWHVSAPKGRLCPWIREGWAMVMADGRITTCCLDASGVGVVGTVDDVIGSLYVKPYSLCGSCDQVIGIKGYEQWPKKGLPVVG